MKLTSKPLAGIIFTILFGGILFTTAMGWWETETMREPARFTSGEASGEYNPADIRGSYTIGEINQHFDVPVEHLALAFGVPLDGQEGSFQVKSLETLYAEQELEIGASSVRWFVAWYAGLPYIPEEGEVLPASAASLLRQYGKLTAEQETYLLTHTLEVSGDGITQALPPAAQTTQPVVATPIPVADEHVASERKVSGQTSFQDLLDWGLPQAEIEAILAAPLPEPSTLVKEYITQQGLGFSEIKNALQAAVDRLP